MIDGKAAGGVEASWTEGVVPVWYKLEIFLKIKKWRKQGEEISDQDDKIRKVYLQ